MRAVADTSVIVASALRSGVGHSECAAAIELSSAGAAGHAWFESFSVLTRLPADVRLSSKESARVLRSIVPDARFLSGEEQAEFGVWLSESGIVGGAVYDALVAWAAKCSGLPLITRDVRALATYRLVGIEVMLINPALA